MKAVRIDLGQTQPTRTMTLNSSVYDAMMDASASETGWGREVFLQKQTITTVRHVTIGCLFCEVTPWVFLSSTGIFEYWPK